MSFDRVLFEVNSESNCCGLLVVGNYIDPTDRWGEPKKRFKTKEEFFKNFESRLEEEIRDYIRDDGNYKGGQYLMQTTLVSSYGGTKIAQFPLVAEYLLSNGWRVNRKWKNSNTGNVVTQYQKILTNKKIRALVGNRGEDNDDYW